MTPIVTDGPTVIAAQLQLRRPHCVRCVVEQRNATAWCSAAAHSVEVDVDIDPKATRLRAEEELLVIIEQLNGTLSGNQVSATPVGSVASASAATEDDVAAVTATTQLDSDTATADIVPLELNGEMVDRQGGSVATAEPTMPMSPAVTAATGQAAPAAAPQNIEVAASPEALQPIGVAPVSTPLQTLLRATRPLSKQSPNSSTTTTSSQSFASTPQPQQRQHRR